MKRIKAITRSTAEGLEEEINLWLNINEDPLIPDKIGKISYIADTAFIEYTIPDQ